MVHFTLDDEQALLTCRFAGELGTTQCMALDQQIAHRVTSFLEARTNVEPEPSIVFDVKEMTYASSFFIRIVLSCVQRVGKDRFSVVHANDFVTGLFRTVGLGEVLKG